jgi:glycerol-3-phosphate cytidylyltransferase
MRLVRQQPLWHSLLDSSALARKKQDSAVTVLTYGTFDMLHIGHINLLMRARQLGDRLIVGVSTDEFNEEKGKRAVMPFLDRCTIIQSLRYVDMTIPETSWEQKKEDIQRWGVSMFVMGDDWKGKFDNLKSYCQVAYLPRTKGISSTQLRGYRNTIADKPMASFAH